MQGHTPAFLFPKFHKNFLILHSKLFKLFLFGILSDLGDDFATRRVFWRLTITHLIFSINEWKSDIG